MDFIKKMLRKCINWAQQDDYAVEVTPMSKHANTWPFNNSNRATIGSNTASATISDNGMNFTVFNAVGGKVVQFSTYNVHTDRHNTSLYVITDKEDLGQELGQILTRESLSR